MTKTANKSNRKTVVDPELPARPEPFRVSLVFETLPAAHLLSDGLQSLGLLVDCYMTGREFLRDVDAHVAGVVFVQTSITDLSISEFMTHIRELNIQPKIVVCAKPSGVPEAIRAVNEDGAFDLMVGASLEAIQAAIVRAYRSWYELDAKDIQKLAEDLETGYERLTAREVEILELVMKGTSSRRIGDVIGRSVKTVEAHRSHIAAKMRTDDVGHLVRMWQAGME